MDQAAHDKIVSFIAGTADGVLRTLAGNSADTLAIGKEAEGLLAQGEPA